MVEMGYNVNRLAFYAISTNTAFPIELPTDESKKELINFIESFKNFNPETDIETNINKCRHCIYCSLCDKIEIENVY